jgi:hypothetical protein
MEGILPPDHEKTGGLHTAVVVYTGFTAFKNELYSYYRQV